MKYVHRWMVGNWNFYQVEDHGFGHDRPLFGFTTMPEKWLDNGQVAIGQFYDSLEHSMAAAIAEKYTGPRGAGGTGVGTAADWFMRMIGADELVDAGETGRRALAESMATHRDRGLPRAATLIERDLERAGLVIARHNPA